MIRGFALSQQIADKLSYDALAPKNDRVSRQRRLLAEVLLLRTEVVALPGGDVGTNGDRCRRPDIATTMVGSGGSCWGRSHLCMHRC